MSTPTDQTVSQTILQQLGGQRFIAMTGAKNFIDHGKGLSFKIGRNCKRVNCVRITLNVLDLYNVEFLNINLGRKNSEWIKTVSEICNIDADNLQGIFTANTGMDTHL